MASKLGKDADAHPVASKLGDERPASAMAVMLLSFGH